MSGTVVIGQPEVLVDEPVGFSVVGCRPGGDVVVTATWTIGDVKVNSEAHFVAPANGTVVPATQPSLGGTYSGVEPYGLWWSIASGSVPEEADPLATWTVTVTASGPGWESTGSLLRLKLDRTVQRVPVRSGRLRGVAFLPSGEGPFPSVVVFSGSGGGLGGLGGVQSSAALLASHGFAALALAYFRYDDLPSDLVDIPLEYFHEGIEWLELNAPALGGRVAVMGASRGGELALLLGATYPQDVAAIVAKVPSGVVWGGLGKEPRPGAVAWTFDGHPVRPLSGARTDPAELPQRDGAIVLTPSFEALITAASPEDLAAAEVPVERVGGPVLLLSGDDDAMWPSVALSEIAVRRAGAKGAEHPFRHLHYPGAGHTFATPAGFPIARSAVHPLAGQLYAYGGSLVGNAHASESSWEEILVFLRTSLATEPVVSSKK
jgi:dienelactone hydrolase